MRITALVEAMVAAGATPDMILVAVRATEAANEHAMEQSRDKTRARVAKWREKNAGNVTDGGVTVTNGLRAGDARVEDKTSNLDIEPVVKNKTRSDASGFEDALRALLDEDRLDALVKHRRSRKAPVTAYAADLFIKAANACGISLAEATDHCIERNWLTVKPDWIAAKPPPRGSPNSVPSMADVFKIVGQRQGDERQSESFGGAGAVVSYLPVAGKGR